jgi:hypothetical protein
VQSHLEPARTARSRTRSPAGVLTPRGPADQRRDVRSRSPTVTGEFVTVVTERVKLRGSRIDHGPTPPLQGIAVGGLLPGGLPERAVSSARPAEVRVTTRQAEE